MSYLAGFDEKVMKHFLDRAIAALTLIIASPLILLVAILLKLESSEPILYVSKRVGKDGRLFDFYNFRTMTTSGDNQKHLTYIGRWIRNYSLDHLPQLFNVIKGDMNLVGPRPSLPDEVNYTEPDWQKIFSVKPGMFSLAILRLAKGYNASSYETRNQIELEYIRQQSFAFDFQVLFRSIQA